MLQNRVSDAIYLVLFKQRISRIYLRILLVLAVLCNLIMEFKFNIIIENFKVYFLLYVNRDCGGLLKRVCNTQFFMKYFAFALVELEFNEVCNLVSYSKEMSLLFDFCLNDLLLLCWFRNPYFVGSAISNMDSLVMNCS